MNMGSVLSQIDSVIVAWENLKSRRKHGDYSDLPDEEVTEVINRTIATVDRLTLPHNSYRVSVVSLVSSHGVNSGRILDDLVGILKAVRMDYSQGYLQTIQELVHADLFADFLEMAEYLLEEGYKDPAAVMVGGVLEEHLRKLAIKNGIQVMENGKPKKADRLNSDLAGLGVHSKLDQKSVTAWLDLRNKAAHGKYNEYQHEQVMLMLHGVQNYLTRLIA